MFMSGHLRKLSNSTKLEQRCSYVSDGKLKLLEGSERRAKVFNRHRHAEGVKQRKHSLLLFLSRVQIS